MMTGLQARIAISATSGPAPLRVSVSAGESLSVSGEIIGYDWDFAGVARANTPQAAFTFFSPGRYTITLTVADTLGREATARVDVRVSGESALAVIQSSTNSGPAPLTVRFDASASSSQDDVILDYYWDFGDGTTSRQSAPTHTYTVSGEYLVSLRVVTAGGVEASATTTVRVGAGGASLQFDGGQFATLPLQSGGAGDPGATAFTVELWFKPDGTGGTLATLGLADVILSADPAANTMRAQVGSATLAAEAFNLAGAWHHVGLTRDANGVATLYLDAVAIGSGNAAGALALQTARIGGSYRGKIGPTRIWSIARTGEAISADARRSLSSGAGLLGDWPFREGRGQTLANRLGGLPGTLGMSSSTEAVDPAWSSDTPY
jgi:PKD repeat protein